MLTRTIPSSGEELPLIGLGTWQAFDVGHREEERAPLRAVLSAFAASGARVIDSSPMYGRAERVLGDLTAELGLRPRLFIATKVWTTGRKSGIDQMEESMRRLRVDHLDLLQVHNLVDARTHLDTLRAWKRDGRVRYIGLTHYTARGAEEIADLLHAEPVDFVQINYGPIEREAERRLFPLTRDRGIAVLANRPLGGDSGRLMKRLSAASLPEWAAEIGCTSWAQLALAFVVSHPAVTCAIPATTRPDHLRDNVRAGAGPLPDQPLRKRIAEAIAQAAG
jgi:aryl-alcohol dehydrogenase-like predicted oxidoreductase